MEMERISFASLKEAVEMFRETTFSVDLVGVEGAALAFLAARIAVETDRTLLVVAPEAREAEILLQDVLFFLGHSQPPGDKTDRIRARILPPSDALPGDRGGLSPTNQSRRIEALWALGSREPSCVIITSASGLTQRVVPREFLASSAFQIFPGTELDRDELERRLIQMGYVRVSLVEEPGELSVRGGVLDLFPPSCHWPIRLEFLGELIESIRLFNPETQRSSRHLDDALILPARELPMAGLLAENAMAELRRRAHKKGYARGLWQNLSEKIAQGVPDPDLSFLLPLFFPRLESALDFLPHGAGMILLHPERLRSAAEELEAHVHGCIQGWQERVGCPVEAPELYMSPEELMQRLNERPHIRAHDVEITDPLKSCQRVLHYKIQSNADIRREILAARSTDGMLTPLVQRIHGWIDEGAAPAIICRTEREQERLASLLEGYGLRVEQKSGPYDPAFLSYPPLPLPHTVTLYRGHLSSGFRMPTERLIFITEEEIFGERLHREQYPRKTVEPFSTDFSDLRPGDFVVHVDHGIGHYRGLERLKLEGLEHDFLHLEYAGNDRLYIPVDRLYTVQKYVGQDGCLPRVDRLGGTSWAKTKKRVEKSLRQMAEELIALYAGRSLAKGHAFSPSNAYIREFEAAFQYEETPDQARAVEEVYADMEHDRTMDRLVCGDVGYGKTEVAMRAGFKAVMDGKQVAMLAPTTVLAEQHLQTFRERFQGHPVEIEALSRFRSRKEQKLILRRLQEGRIDILIGTHRLLSKDVVFHDLGLLIVDEEQRFGVAHKERVKQLRRDVDVMTLTATPIPRTLNMSLLGIRDLSVIETPPEDRLAIRTQLSRFDPQLIRESIERELARGGQVFFVHNRVQSIHAMAEFLRRLIPQARIGVAHGQMPEQQLELVMLRFVRKEINLLVCTNIIESGLDIPSANTIIINRADQFGLADIYQLRGRVGRSAERAYAYLLIPPEGVLTPESSKRLQAILEYTDLGSGFKIALKDLEIRGAGNILGRDQSGHIAAIGYEMYIRLLETAVRQLKGEKVVEEMDPEIHLPVAALLPQEYVPDTGQRLQLYRRLSAAKSAEDVEAMREELSDVFGALPEETRHLLEIMHIRVLLKRLRIRKLDLSGRHLVLAFDESTPVSPGALVEMISLEPWRYRWVSEQKLMVRLVRGEMDKVLEISKNILNQISQCDNSKRS